MTTPAKLGPKPVDHRLLTDPATFLAGVRTSLLIAAAVAAASTATALLLRTPRTRHIPRAEAS